MPEDSKKVDFFSGRWCWYYGEVMILSFSDGEEGVIEKIADLLTGEDSAKHTIYEFHQPADFSQLQIDWIQHQVRSRGRVLELTYSEYRLLCLLVKQPGKVFTYAQIYREVYEEEESGDTENIIYCLMRGLRKKLEKDSRHPEFIQTVRGVGYKFIGKVEIVGLAD